MESLKSQEQYFIQYCKRECRTTKRGLLALGVLFLLGLLFVAFDDISNESRLTPIERIVHADDKEKNRARCKTTCLFRFAV
ncbi:MAG: hypothetical protein US74_C0003G0035 [Parcubacteria group bacterium GW2011_GWA2_38_13]|nr:MAG: hypothetical protein US74_C0003G0035 [Parcubacteria group bacterium GW2011_GWA2_38_13]